MADRPMSDYYHLHPEAYHEATFHIDPESFLRSLPGRPPPALIRDLPPRWRRREPRKAPRGALILDVGCDCRPGLVACFCNSSRLRFRHMGAGQCCGGLRLPPRIGHAMEDDPYGGRHLRDCHEALSR